MNPTVCCFTGHREIPALRLPRLKKELKTAIETLIAQGVTEFRAGGARGFDTIAAEAVLEAKEHNPAIRLVLMLPCRTQVKGWGTQDIIRYFKIWNQADEKNYVSHKYAPGCMHTRNRWLVDGSSICVAYCEKETGGSAYTIRYAREKGLTIWNLAKK